MGGGRIPACHCLWWLEEPGRAALPLGLPSPGRCQAPHTASVPIPCISAVFVKNRSKLRPRKSHRKRLGLPWSIAPPPRASAQAEDQKLLPGVVFHVGRMTVSFLRAHSCPAPCTASALGGPPALLSWFSSPSFALVQPIFRRRYGQRLPRFITGTLLLGAI